MSAAPAPALAKVLGDLPSRGLPIPRPPGRREPVVLAALKKLEGDNAAGREKALETIEKYGLTIEIDRLRERLNRAATTELQRLLLSTPGVPETLLNEAIKKQLEELEKLEHNVADDVKDATVVEVGEQLAAVKDGLHSLTATAASLESFSQKLADALGKVAEALGSREGADPKSSTPRRTTASKSTNAPAVGPEIN